MATRHPKGSRWSVTELRNLPPVWAGDHVSDGDEASKTGVRRVARRIAVTAAAPGRARKLTFDAHPLRSAWL